jgi:hypothetical protein
MAMSRLRPLLGGLALGIALVFVPVGNALAAADSQAPTTPTLNLTAQTATSVRLTWRPATDDSGSADIAYLIDDGSVTHTVNRSTLLFLGNLETNRTYTFTIRARDRSGNLSGTTQVSAYLENVPPSAPTNLRQIGTDRGQVVLGWDVPADNSGTVVGYTVYFNGDRFQAVEPSIRVADLIDECVLLPGPAVVTFQVTAIDPSRNISAASAGIQVPVI